MRIGTRAAWSFVALTSLVLAAAAPAAAVKCGDANRSDTVTVTDGVLILRSAAQLQTLCPRERCDMNVDGTVSVTDGVLALRVAAEIETSVACSATQSGTIFGQVQKISGLGSIAGPASRTRAAGGTTIACAGGGSLVDDGTTLTYLDCVAGDFVTNGTLTFTDDGAGNVEVSFDTTDLVISTGEVNETFGSLTFTFGNRVEVNGVLGHTSTIVGEYVDGFRNVLLDENSFAESGRIATVVVEGRGFFTNVLSIASTIFSPTTARVVIEYASGAFDVFTIGDSFCEPCSTTCPNGLECVSCVGQCSNTTARCGIDFDALECADGIFGPVGLCDPCTSDSECNQNDGLTCFDCDSKCTGSTRRCGSSLAFVECVDGIY